MTMKKIVLSILAAGALSGCASINSVSLTPVPAQRSKVVRAQVSKTVFLGFNFDNDFINPLVDDLKRQCPSGVVSGILTKDEVIAYVLVFTRRVTATGYCSNGSTQARRGGRSSASDEGADFGDADEGGETR